MFNIFNTFKVFACLIYLTSKLFSLHRAAHIQIHLKEICLTSSCNHNANYIMHVDQNANILQRYCLKTYIIVKIEPILPLPQSRYNMKNIKHALNSQMTPHDARRQMETFSVLLTLCEGNPPVTRGFPSQRTVTRSFDVRLNKRLHKQWSRRLFEAPGAHCDVSVMSHLSFPGSYGISAVSAWGNIDCVITVLHWRQSTIFSSVRHNNDDVTNVSQQWVRERMLSDCIKSLFDPEAMSGSVNSEFSEWVFDLGLCHLIHWGTGKLGQMFLKWTCITVGHRRRVTAVTRLQKMATAKNQTPGEAAFDHVVGHGSLWFLACEQVLNKANLWYSNVRSPRVRMA